jgi:hypothetical protein
VSFTSRAVTVAVLLACSCSDRSAPPPADRTTVPTTDAHREPGSTQPLDAVPIGACPGAIPDPNSACTREGLVCEYGTNPRCLSFAECQGGHWMVAMPKCMPPDPSCPATREAAAGQGCATTNAYCIYSGLACDCTNCTLYPVQSCSGPLTWHCEAPSADASCPAARPNRGTACSVEGKLCEYGCEQDASRKCVGGAWVAATAPGGCPKSTRRAKRDIVYLDDAALRRVAQQAAQLRLATYRYRDPALDGRTHLGFILEDHPRSPASDLDRQEVDLYSFTSMALALAQDQRRQLEALRVEIRSVRARLARCGSK